MKFTKKMKSNFESEIESKIDNKAIKEKGSISVFVLLSMLFFLVVIVSVVVFYSNKKIAIESQYQAISDEYEKEEENIEIDTSYGRIDVIWLDTSNNVINEPNSPSSELNGMKPVVFNETSSVWEDTSSSLNNWYNYSTNQWANAMTANNSYFVWIPRFAYRITYYKYETDFNNKTNPTGYYDGYGMWDATTGNVKYTLDDGIKTVISDGKNYIVHPAFETNLDMGGWSTELSGFWFAKFEMGGTITNLNSTYGTSSLRSQTIGIQYTAARQATYGMTTGLITEENEGSNEYTSFMNSHMCKNSEWGAVAYLTQSKYGRNGIEMTINDNSSYYRGGGSDTAYITNKTQSTTGNVYGIYDMSGNSWERVAAFNNTDTNGKLDEEGWTTATGLKTNSNSTKFATKYNNTTSSASGNAVIYNYGKVGDATKEVNAQNNYNWFFDYQFFTNSSAPFFSRGGNNNNKLYAGVFNSLDNKGYGFYDGSFRTVLCH